MACRARFSQRLGALRLDACGSIGHVDELIAAFIIDMVARGELGASTPNIGLSKLWVEYSGPGSLEYNEPLTAI